MPPRNEIRAKFDWKPFCALPGSRRYISAGDFGRANAWEEAGFHPAAPFPAAPPEPLVKPVADAESLRRLIVGLHQEDGEGRCRADGKPCVSRGKTLRPGLLPVPRTVLVS